MNEHENPITRMIDAYTAAVNAKDVDAFIGLYDQDVCVFDMWREWSHSGLAVWRRTVADWFGSLGTERVAVDVDMLRSTVTHDVAVAHAFVTYRAVSPDGNELRAMQNRLTWALKQQDGVWKIFHEHTSTPVDFDTLKQTLPR